ncbi:MAG: DNA polymerase I [Patescibacteria group bacterium]
MQEGKQQNKKLFLIDSNALIFRAYHAIPVLKSKGPGSQDRNVNAVYGFFLIFFKTLQNYNPDYIICTFDSINSSKIRKDKYSWYKANRSATPEDLIDQFDYVKDILKTLNTKVYEEPFYEADDIIASVIENFKNKDDIDIYVMTGDKDLLQLISRNVSLLMPLKSFSDPVEINSNNVKEYFGMEPNMVTTYKGLRGDPSDNIPGVPGIGDKGAKDLVNEFGNINSIYKNIDKIKPNIAKKLMDNKKSALESFDAASLYSNLSLKDLDLEKSRILFNHESVISKLDEYQFKSLINKYFPDYVKSQNIESEKTGGLNGVMIEDISSFSNFVHKLEKVKEFAFLCTIYDKDKLNEGLLPFGMSVYTGGEDTTFINLNNSDIINSKEFENFKNIFKNKKIRKIGYDIKKQMHFLENLYIKVNGIYFDTQIAYFILKNKNTSLKNIILDVFDKNLYDIDVIESSKGIKLDKKIIPKIYCDYSRYIYDLYKYIDQQFSKDNVISDVFFNIDMPLIQILYIMECNGIKLNKGFLNKLYDKFELELKDLEKAIYKIAGVEFNISSPAQLGNILFKTLSLKSSGKRKSGIFNTEDSVLESIEADSPIIPLIRRYKEVSKIKNTYTKNLVKLTDSSSRLHTRYSITGASTGRLSSSDPNLQNIPIRTETGRQIREAFVADKGKMLFSFDYSQIELRIMAHYSGDPSMKYAFLHDEDIHKYTASIIFKKKPEDITREERSIAKTINFGVIYGISSFGLSRQLGISRLEADTFIKNYFATFSNISKYYDWISEFIKEHDYVETLYGRRRYFDYNKGYVFEKRIFREAINMPIQGTSADIIKIAMIKIGNGIINRYDADMILQIHDELIFEVSNEVDYNSFVHDITNAMIEGFKLNVALKVDVKYGINWKNMTNYKKL